MRLASSVETSPYKGHRSSACIGEQRVLVQTDRKVIPYKRAIKHCRPAVRTNQNSQASPYSLA